MAKFISFLKTKPIFTAILAVVFSMMTLQSISAETNWEMAVERMLLCGTMLFFLYQISGERTTSQCGNSTWYVIKVCIGFWIFAGVFGALGFLGQTGTPYADWPIRLIILAILMLFVGLFEELTFRAILNDAIIIRFRNWKGAFVLSAVVCSLVFGAVHVVGAPLTTPLEWAQAVGKTISTGVFGLGLLFMYWRTRNVWACGIVHGVYDFIISLSEAFFETESVGSYVVEGAAGVPVVIMYAITTVITGFIVWRIWKAINRDLDFEQLRQNW